MKYMNHSKRVPLSTSGFQSCVDGVGMESCNGINGNLLHMLKLLELHMLSRIGGIQWHHRDHSPNRISLERTVQR